jgi:hypothetical protein
MEEKIALDQILLPFLAMISHALLVTHYLRTQKKYTLVEK